MDDGWGVGYVVGGSILHISSELAKVISGDFPAEAGRPPVSYILAGAAEAGHPPAGYVLAGE